MGKYERIYDDIMNSRHDKNINFKDLCNLLEKLGFTLRIKGDHFIYYKEGIIGIIDLQPSKKDHAKAKPYQVKQVRILFQENNIGKEGL